MSNKTEIAAVEGSIVKTIRERRTIREFKPDEVSKEIVIEILNDSTWAPNHGTREPWRFVLFHGDGRKKFADAVIQETYSKEDQEKWADKMYEYYMNIPIHLLVVMEEDPRQKKWEEDLCATAALIQNFQLLAWEKNLGVVWKTNNYNWEPSFLKAVGIQPGEKVVGTLHIGYFDKIPKPKSRTRVEQKLTIVE